MLTIDEIKIEPDEDGWHLVIYSDDSEVEGATSEAFRFRIGLPDQFHAETERTLGAWLAEGEREARAYAIERGDAPNSRNADLDDDANLDDLTGRTILDADQMSVWDDPDLARDRMRGK